MSIKRVLYVGNLRPPYSTENDVKSALEELGVEVVTVQEDEAGDWSAIASLISHGPTKPDLILYTRTWGIKGDGLSVWKEARQRGVPTASYHLDMYVGLMREPNLGEVGLGDPFWATDYVFTADGDPRCDAWLKKRGINHFWLPPAIKASSCYIADPDAERFPCPIIFVGSEGYHPEWPYRKLLLEWLANTYGDRFHRYGNPDEVIRGHDLNVLYATAKVVVGDSLILGFTHENYWSDRAPETLGRGGLLIHPRVKGMDRFFEDRKHLVNYELGDFEELKARIDYYLDPVHEAEARAIRRAGLERVKKAHTYTHRLRWVLDYIERNGRV